MKLYVIGPVSGIENDNRQEFERVKSSLCETDKYQCVYIPHEFIEPDTEWEWSMCGCIQLITDQWAMHGDGFAIAMLDGWEDSKGATIEHDLAEALGIPCKLWREWL